jgi:hypothetical protein
MTNSVAFVVSVDLNEEVAKRSQEMTSAIFRPSYIKKQSPARNNT